MVEGCIADRSAGRMIVKKRGGGAEEEGGERRVYKGELIVSKTARTAP